ncbi:MAG: prolyl oligopeptidase family serine peptidase [Pseudobdellovibrio sp.]
MNYPTPSLQTIHFIKKLKCGEDATVAREFDLNKKDFVVNGFSFPEAKSNFTWVSDNEIIWADATDPNKISASGYPQQLKIIKRHQMLSEATLFAEMPKDYLMAYSFKVKDADKYYHFISYSITGTTTEYYYLPDVKNLAHKIKVPVPVKSQIIGIAYQQVLFKISHSFKANNNDYEAGTILAFDLADIEKSNITYKLVFKPEDNRVLEDILISKHQTWVSVLEDVKPKIYLAQYQKSQWSHQNFTSENDANSWAIATSSVESEHVYLIKSGFLTPNEYLYINDIHPKISQAQSILKSPSCFNEDDFVVYQYKAKSSDGVEIPYFTVHKKNMHYNSLNPTLLYGYRGFEIPLTPYYSGTLGKAWLERNGVYVYANIRGGGEFGPKWHQSAIRDKKQLSYDDFISIAEDLIHRKITSPKHLGIKGGSNGGLLTSVMLTQRPDLFNAVISAVPLTNMIRFSKLLAGAFWMDEYGNPENETDKKILLEYSPLHNLKDGVKYPEAFFTTSTKDDRVHPGHARQMVARLRELNQNVIYFENTDGGHGGAKNNNEMASLLSMEYVYLFQKLK